MRNWFDQVLVSLGVNSPLESIRGAIKTQDARRKEWVGMQEDSIRRELAERGRDAGEYERRQLAYRVQWLKLNPRSGRDEPPQQLDAAMEDHVTFALNIVAEYDEALQNAGEFADCLYRPSSALPFPSEAIRKSCELLLRIADGTVVSAHRDRHLIMGERDAIAAAVFSLDYFIDVAAADIPTDRLKNLAFGKKQYRSGPALPPKPRPGELVVTKNPDEKVYIDQVIGSDSSEQWIVCGKSGVPLQVAYNPEINGWEEVNSISPATAAWLRFTGELPRVDFPDASQPSQ